VVATIPVQRWGGNWAALSAVALALSVIALAITARTAHGAATRAEYVAQVDPTCEAAIAPQQKALRTFRKAFRHFENRVESGRITRGTFTKLLRQTAGFLGRFKALLASVTTQIEAVPPPPGDSGTVALWLQGRRDAEQLLGSAVSALKHRKMKVYFLLLDQGEATDASARFLVSSFGFRYCA
jgi:hypothetical protein